jgi:hypothetical protein
MVSGVHVTRFLVLCVCFVDRCLSFCVVCSSSIYGFWLPLWYLQTLLRFNICVCYSGNGYFNKCIHGFRHKLQTCYFLIIWTLRKNKFTSYNNEILTRLWENNMFFFLQICMKEEPFGLLKEN